MDKRRLYTLIDEIFPLVKNISFVPETEELPVSNMEMHRLYSENLVVISVKIISHGGTINSLREHSIYRSQPSGRLRFHRFF